MLTVNFKSINNTFIKFTDFIIYKDESGKENAVATLKIHSDGHSCADPDCDRTKIPIRSEIEITDIEAESLSVFIDNIFKLDDEKIEEISIDALRQNLANGGDRKDLFNNDNYLQFRNIALFLNDTEVYPDGELGMTLVLAVTDDFDTNYFEIVVEKAMLPELVDFFDLIYKQIVRETEFYNRRNSAEELDEKFEEIRIEESGDSIHKGFDDLDELLKSGIIKLD